MLKKVDFIDLFSLANNHVNDSDLGLNNTLKILSENKLSNNGLYYDKYSPLNL